MEPVNVGTQQPRRFEPGERSCNLRLAVCEQLGDLMVHVDDVVLGIRHHHAAGYVVQCRADTQILRGMTTLRGLTLRLLPLRRTLRGEVSPLDHGTEMHRIFVDHRIGDDAECAPSDLELTRKGPFEIRQQLALVRRVGMKHVDIVAKDVISVEMRQLLLEIGFRLLEHLPDGIVHVDHVQIGIRHHHVGRRTIERGLHACCLIGTALRIRNLETELDLGRADDLLQFTDDAALAGLRPIEVLSGHELGELAGRVAQRFDHMHPGEIGEAQC